MIGIPGDMTGFAEKLKEANYKTYLFGKWDAGFANWKQVWYPRWYIPFIFYMQNHIIN